MAKPTLSDELLFDAVLRPHRSLSKPGFLILMGFIAVVSFASGMLFLLQGAWPVMGFFGLEVGLVYVAFKMNYRASKLFETVQLDTSQLLVRRIDPKGRAASWSFQPNWLRVAMDDPPEHESQLTLTTHGRSLTIGAFLTPEERLQIAQELRAALAHWRQQPVT